MNPSSVAETRKQVQTTCSCNKVRSACLPAAQQDLLVTVLLGCYQDSTVIRSPTDGKKATCGQRVNMGKYCHVSGMNLKTFLSYSQPPYCVIQKSSAEFLFCWEMQESHIHCHMIQFINSSKMLNTSPFSYLKGLFVLAFLDILRFAILSLRWLKL